MHTRTDTFAVGNQFIANLILMNAIEVICQGVMISALKMDAETCEFQAEEAGGRDNNCVRMYAKARNLQRRHTLSLRDRNEKKIDTKIMDIIFSCAYTVCVLWLVGVIASARLWARREFGPSMRAEIVTRTRQGGRGGGGGGGGGGGSRSENSVRKGVEGSSGGNGDEDGNDINKNSKNDKIVSDASTTQRVDVFEV